MEDDFFGSYERDDDYNVWEEGQIFLDREGEEDFDPEDEEGEFPDDPEDRFLDSLWEGE